MDNAQYMPPALKANAGDIPAQLSLQVAVSSLASGLPYTVCMMHDIRLQFVLLSPVLWPRTSCFESSSPQENTPASSSEFTFYKHALPGSRSSKFNAESDGGESDGHN